MKASDDRLFSWPLFLLTLGCALYDDVPACPTVRAITEALGADQ